MTIVGLIGVRAKVADGRICGRFCEQGHWIGDMVLSSIVDKNDGGEMGDRMERCGSAGLPSLFIYSPVLPVLVCETFAQRVLRVLGQIPMTTYRWKVECGQSRLHVWLSQTWDIDRWSANLDPATSGPRKSRMSASSLYDRLCRIVMATEVLLF